MIAAALTRRERRLIAGVLALSVALLVAVGVALTGAGGDGAHRGCLDVSFASTLGVQQLIRCGASARETCATVGGAGGFTGRVGRLVVADCRRLRLPVG